MEQLREAVMEELERLRLLTSSDFSAFARIGRQDRLIRFPFASGNVNDKYKQLILKAGRGLSGHAVRLGRPVVADRGTPQLTRLRQDYPIMLAERLLAAAAVPIGAAEETRGVLIVGSRSERFYRPPDLLVVQGSAVRLAGCMRLYEPEEDEEPKEESAK